MVGLEGEKNSGVPCRRCSVRKPGGGRLVANFKCLSRFANFACLASLSQFGGTNIAERRNVREIAPATQRNDSALRSV